MLFFVFFFKQKTAYEMRISDWSSDVCSSDLSLRARLELENAYLQEEIRIEGNHRGIIGNSAAIQSILRQVDLVAPTDATVLVTGESGTGKEQIGRASCRERGCTSG